MEYKKYKKVAVTTRKRRKGTAFLVDYRDIDGTRVQRVVANAKATEDTSAATARAQDMALEIAYKLNNSNHQDIKETAVHISESHNKIDQSGYVYFITQSNTHYVKIGVSKNPPERLKQLQTANPVKLSIIAQRKYTDMVQIWESAIHGLLSQYRVEGEWFLLPPEMIDAIRKTNGENIMQAWEDKALGVRWARSEMDRAIVEHRKIRETKNNGGPQNET